VTGIALEWGQTSGRRMDVQPAPRFRLRYARGGSATVDGLPGRRKSSGRRDGGIDSANPEANHDLFRRDQNDIDGSSPLKRKSRFTRVIAIEDGWGSGIGLNPLVSSPRYGRAAKNTWRLGHVRRQSCTARSSAMLGRNRETHSLLAPKQRQKKKNQNKGLRTGLVRPTCMFRMNLS